MLRLDITQWNCQKNTKVPYFPIHVHKTLNLKAASHPKEKSSHKEAEQPYVSSFLFCAFYVHINRYTSCLVQLQWPGYTFVIISFNRLTLTRAATFSRDSTFNASLLQWLNVWRIVWLSGDGLCRYLVCIVSWGFMEFCGLYDDH